MQRGKVVSTDQLDTLKKRNDEAHWVIGEADKYVKKLPYEFDRSYTFCEGLLPIGRMSYMNFNPLVEKTHKELLKKAKMKYSVNEDEEEGLSDSEMARRYETLVDTIDKKFQPKKRKASDSPVDLSSDSESDEDIKQLKKRARRGFLKPKVD